MSRKTQQKVEVKYVVTKKSIVATKDEKNCKMNVVTQKSMSRHNEKLNGLLRSCRDIKFLCRDKDFSLSHFFYFSYWNYLFFHLKPEKHKVREYSIIQY